MEVVGVLDEAELLTTIPGVGPYTVLLIHSEIGDIRRFSDPEKLCSYAGLVPRVEQSGHRVKRGGITKQVVALGLGGGGVGSSTL